MIKLPHPASWNSTRQLLNQGSRGLLKAIHIVPSSICRLCLFLLQIHQVEQHLCSSFNPHLMKKYSLRIPAASTAKQAWEILNQEFFGDKKVIVVKLQTIRSQFENLVMKNKESVQGFLSRVSGVISQMKIYGDAITSETIVGKVLRSLHSDYKYIVTAILESKDLSTYTFDELMSSLIAHEERMGKSGGENVDVFKSRESFMQRKI